MPSTSIKRIAPESVGKPAWMYSSTARRVQPSIISQAAGVMPRAVMSATVSEASSTVSKIAIRVLMASGLRKSLTVISVTNARVPSDPTKRAVRS